MHYRKYISENFKTAATLAFKARGCYCDYYITVECSFLCLLKKDVSCSHNKQAILWAILQGQKNSSMSPNRSHKT